MKHFIFLLIAVAALSSCDGGSGLRERKQNMRDTARDKVVGHAVQNEFYSLPSPLEVAYVVQSTGVEYNERFLHQTELGVRYSTNMAAAINLGIYGADLSYSIYFNQQQVALKYLDCIKELSSSLDISDILTQNKLKEMEDNIQNKEALKKIVTKTFLHSDALLKENSRRGTAVMISFGMWIESLYISAQLSTGNPEHNPALAKCIVEQGLVFEDLWGMLNSLDETHDISTIKKELEVLSQSYGAIKNSKGGVYVSRDEEFSVDSALFAKLCDDVQLVRTNFTQLF
ncbi:MAG: hypothetical protein MJZ61_02470 [Bacteroidales bacterium]|nr:hypothetical protein [Bacteroidales bacterium]